MFYKSALKKKDSTDNIKSSSINHVSIVMDGNGRWAKKRGLPRTAGHKKGADILKKTCEYCIEHAISYLTVYAFSAENWNRSSDEVDSLMNLLRYYMDKELSSFKENGIKLKIIGDRSLLAEDIRQKITNIEEETANNNKLTTIIALSYGGRQEIVNAARLIALDISNNNISANEINERLFKSYLYTDGTPDPDLLIRTGGEERISNFLLWQMAYTEFYFTDILWPDFSKEEFDKAIEEFHSRERRFGKV